MWSKKHEKCTNCGTTSIKHLAKGLCLKCYSCLNEKKQNNIAGHKRGVIAELLTKEKLIQLYVEDKLSLGDIGNLVGTSRTNVHAKLKKFNIPIRNRAKSRAIALDKGKFKYLSLNDDGEAEEKTRNKIHYDGNFFSKWSNEMAYVLGLIYTDGNIDPGILNNPTRETTLRIGRLTFGQNEKELVEKFLNLIGSDSKILYRSRTKSLVSNHKLNNGSCL